MCTKITAAFLAGGLLIGAGFLTAMISAPGSAQAQEETEEPEDEGPFPRILGFLDEVLVDLVADDTLTQDQADAVSAAAVEKAEEVLERVGEHQRRWRPFARGFRFGALLDDGGIDQDEYDALDDRHPLKQLDLSAQLEDGLITPKELRELFLEWSDDREDT